MFHWPIRVYYEDTDASGVVYHARYLHFFERARTEFLRAAGHGQHDLMEQHGLAFTIARVSIDYRRPARLDDSLVVGTNLATGRALIEFQQELRRDHGGELLASASVRAGCVRMSDFRPQRIPASIATALKAFTSS
ncbi:MAG: tol-pal system-associated acyl-CoA thioesterase [Oceanococcaceae bacterium]